MSMNLCTHSFDLNAKIRSQSDVWTKISLGSVTFKSIVEDEECERKCKDFKD